MGGENLEKEAGRKGDILQFGTKTESSMGCQMKSMCIQHVTPKTLRRANKWPHFKEIEGS